MLKVKEKLTILELKRTRFLCYDCGQTFSAKTDLVDEHHQLTKELKQAILIELYENQSRNLKIRRSTVGSSDIGNSYSKIPRHWSHSNGIIIDCLNDQLVKQKSLMSC
ncbi:hypothetical protein AS275_01280 [Enterococcus faecium]|nr:hypothetical protein AS275_01280 [Enterococcus faecium]